MAIAEIKTTIKGCWVKGLFYITVFKVDYFCMKLQSVSNVSRETLVGELDVENTIAQNWLF